MIRQTSLGGAVKLNYVSVHVAVVDLHAPECTNSMQWPALDWIRLPLELNGCVTEHPTCSEVFHKPLTARIASLPCGKPLTRNQRSLVMNFSVQLRKLEQYFTYLLSFSGCGDHSVFWISGMKQPGGEADHAILVSRL